MPLQRARQLYASTLPRHRFFIDGLRSCAIAAATMSNQSQTWTNVWTYTSIPSVQEIVVLRTDRVGAELMRGSREGDWPERPLTITEGNLVLESIGFEAALSELYARTRLRS